MVHRIIVSRTLNDSPFFFLYGRDPQIPNDLKYPVKKIIAIENPDLDVYKLEQLKTLKYAYERLWTRRDFEQAKYKQYHDQTHKNITFQIGESVMLYWPSKKTGVGVKLLPKWDGPYRVLARLNEVTYRIHNGRRLIAVHVERLRKYKPWVRN
jgi:hypothetical protein